MLFDSQNRSKRPTTEKKLRGVNWAPETKRGNTEYKYFRKSIQKAFVFEPIQVRQYISKSVEPIEKSLYIEGIATSTDVDFDGDRCTKDCLLSLNQQFNSGVIPLKFGHKAGLGFGKFEGSKLDGNRLLVRAKLFEDNPITNQVLELVAQGKSFGFSIAGEAYGRRRPDGIREFTNVNLLECSLVDVPANPKARALRLVDTGNN